MRPAALLTLLLLTAASINTQAQAQVRKAFCDNSVSALSFIRSEPRNGSSYHSYEINVENVRRGSGMLRVTVQFIPPPGVPIRVFPTLTLPVFERGGTKFSLGDEAPASNRANPAIPYSDLFNYVRITCS